MSAPKAAMRSRASDVAMIFTISVLSRDAKASLFHGELDCFHGAWQIQRIVLALVGFNRRDEHVEALALRHVGLCHHPGFDCLEGGAVVGLGLDGFDVHRRFAQIS